MTEAISTDELEELIFEQQRRVSGALAPYEVETANP